MTSLTILHRSDILNETVLQENRKDQDACAAPGRSGNALHPYRRALPRRACITP